MKWISIKTKLPKQYKNVLFYDNYFDVIYIGHLDHKLWFDCDGIQYNNITHWMKLPEAPFVKNIPNEETFFCARCNATEQIMNKNIYMDCNTNKEYSICEKCSDEIYEKYKKGICCGESKSV